MRSILFAILVAGVVGPLAAQAPLTHTLMPVPMSVQLAPATLRIDTTFTVGVVHYRDGRLDRAIARAVTRLRGRAGVALTDSIGSSSAATLVIDVAARGFAVPDLDEDESYHLDVTAEQATLKANTVVGAIRGLETFLQLQTTDSSGVVIQGATITDAPRFKWRGLLLDVARHFEPIDVIKRTLDGMAMVKLNVLHWHLSDDQGFRVESKVYPRLQGMGSDSEYYTQDQIREVVAYAADRGIRVMPEFDMPGHSSAWFVGYPDLAVGPGPFEIARTWGVFRPTMDPTRESTYRFLDRFLGEMAALFPDKYWHIGGDEVDPDAWKASNQIQEWMKRHDVANEVALQTHFNQRLFAIVQKHGKIPVGWDEIFQPGLPQSAVIQSWRSTDALASTARAGYRGILSAPYYIDHQKPTSDFYLPDPIPASTTLTPAQQAMVLGGEACMWGEYVTPETIDSRIWPRLAAIAERFWSPANVNDVADMYRRLDVTARRLEEFGLKHEDHSRRMLRRIAGDSAPLFESLLDYVRPQDFGGSGRWQAIPHTRLIDAAVADPVESRAMLENARAAAAGDVVARSKLRLDFATMASLDQRLAAVRVTEPAAADAAPIAAVLDRLASVGTSALDYLTEAVAPPNAWRASADSLLAQVAPRYAFSGLRPAMADAVRTLVNAASALPPPRSSP